MEIEKEEIEGAQVFRISGRLDAATAPILEKHLLNEIGLHQKKVLLDFLNVDYLSSSGLRVLFVIKKKLQAEGREFVLFAINDTVMEVVKMAGFDRLFKITSSQKKALEL